MRPVRKGLIAVGVLLVLVPAGLAIAPEFIDWSHHKDRLTAMVEDATGRAVQIGGDLSVSLLPPSLVARDVRLANLPEASTPDMLRVDTARFRVSVPALLRGEIALASLELNHPVVVLERLPDGRVNWDFAAEGAAASGPEMAARSEGRRAQGAVPAPAGGAGAEPVSAPDVRLDVVTITGGKLIYRAPGRAPETVEDIDLSLTAETLSGPFEVDATFAARGARVALEGTLGDIRGGRSAPIRGRLAVEDEAAELTLSGFVGGRGADRGVRGTATLRMPDPARLARLADAVLPAALARPVGLTGALTVTRAGLAVTDMTVTLGAARATGEARVDWTEDRPVVDLALELGALDLDAWQQAGIGGGPGPGTGPGPRQAALPSLVAPARAAEPLSFTLPDTLTATIDLSAPAVTWRGRAVRDVVANLALSDGEMLVNQLSASIPGSGEAAVFGALRTAGGIPAADLSIELRADNLRGTLTWLGVTSVPGGPGRLQKVDLRGALRATPAEVRLEEINGVLDATRLGGAVAWRTGPGPRLWADLRADAINLDAYLAREDMAPPPAPGATTPETADDGAPPEDTARQPAAAPTLFAALRGIDGDVTLAVERLVWRTVPVRDARLHAVIGDGTLTLSGTRFGDIAGASLSLDGAVTNLAGVPGLDGLTYELSVPDPEALGRTLDIVVPPLLTRLAPLALAGRLQGDLNDLRIESENSLGGGRLAVTGMIQAPLGATEVDARLDLHHPDAGRLLRALQPGYRPQGPLGEVTLTAHLAGTAETVTFNGLRLAVAGSDVTGQGQVALTAARPQVTATLAAGRLIVDPFLPAKRQAKVPVTAPARVMPATYRPIATRTAPAPGWLREVDATLDLTARDVRVQGLRLTDARTAMVLEDGVATLTDLTGGLFGGTLEADGRLDATDAVPAWQATVRAAGVRLGDALEAFGERRVADGLVGLSGGFTARGSEGRALLASLNGSGALRGDRITVHEEARGPLAAVLGPMTVVDRLVTAGDATGGLAEVRGDYTVRDGVVEFHPLTLGTPVYTGRFTGTVDLPRERVDLAGKARVSPTGLSLLLKDKVNLPNEIDVTVKGPLRAPNVKTGKVRLEATPDALMNILKGLRGD